MEPNKYKLKNEQDLLIREVMPEDGVRLLKFVNEVSSESDFLSFGPDEFELSETEEEDFIRICQNSDNRIFIMGLINETIVAILHFAAGFRPRVRHTGEFGMTVSKKYWDLGIGSLMLDTLIKWAKETKIVMKINLRVRTDNQSAIHLYEKKGFSVEGTILREVYFNGEYFDHYWMGLQL